MLGGVAFETSVFVKDLVFVGFDPREMSWRMGSGDFIPESTSPLHLPPLSEFSTKFHIFRERKLGIAAFPSECPWCRPIGEVKLGTLFRHFALSLRSYRGGLEVGDRLHQLL